MASLSDADVELAADLVRFHHDPLGFVLYAFAWGKGELANASGPRPWQRDVLSEVGTALRAGADLGAAMQPVLEAVSSGHGIGKSALVSWLILWALSTMEDTKVVVTANTEPQLRTKTWPEVSKWHRLAINTHWFECTATSLYAKDNAHEKTWRADAITWSDSNTEAFAGLHNVGKRIVLIFDEASAISDRVWEVAEGALTDESTEILWFAFGNPTRNTGRFRECFGRLKHRWHHRQIDSREVDGTNKQQIQKWIDDYGVDSDFVRVRVRGVFPNAGSMQFIASDIVDQASRIEAVCTLYDPLILGVDVARFGDDQSVVCLRRGRDARTFKWLRFSGIDTMTLAAAVMTLIAEKQPEMVFVDETGIGGAVIDRLKMMGHMVQGVNNGARPDVPIEGELVANKGAECWARMRQWLRTGGAIPADRDLMGELEGREHGYNQHNQIVLERKDDMKKRGLSSPDSADALALTFAYPVAARGDNAMRSVGHAVTEWDPV